MGQTALFTLSNGALGVLVAVSMALVARSVTEEQFGSYSFAISYFLLSALIFEFGLFPPASRLIAQTDELEERRRIIGASLIVCVPIAIAYGGTTFAVSLLVDDLFNVEAGEAIRLSAPLAFVYAFRLIGLQLAQGAGRLHVFSVTSLLGQAAFVTALLIVVMGRWDLNVELALVLRSAGIGVGWLLLVAWLRPAFSDARRWLRRLYAEAREWGFQVYVGRVLSLGSYNMDVIMVGAFADAREVGLYALAAGLATAIGFPLVGLGNALFPRMVRATHLDVRWLLAAYAVGAIGVVAVIAISRPVIEVFFSERYTAATAFLFPLALAQSLRGVTWIYHQFLAAQASGRDLRNAALILTVSNLVLNFALIPPFGATGAAWASVVALLANLAAHIVFYRRRSGERVLEEASRRGAGTPAAPLSPDAPDPGTAA